MTLLRDDHRRDAEDHVRAMLQRLAADAHADPPAWEDLLERRDAEVVPLGIATSNFGTIRSRRPDRRPRVIRAAAAGVLLLAAVGALVVGRGGSGPTDPTAETISVVSPGDPSFDPGVATAVWVTDQADPVAATLAYLAAGGVVAGATPPAATLRGNAGTTAVVDWSLPTAAGGSGGTVYLRSSGPTGTPPTWTIVGSSASDVAFSDVGYDGSRLSFTVTGADAGSGQVAVAAWIDGGPVSLGGDPVAWAGSDDISLGELVEPGSDPGDGSTLGLPADADDVVTLRAVRVVDGMVRSVTQMAVALPDADHELATEGAPAIDTGDDTIGPTDEGFDGTPDSAGAEAEADAEADAEAVADAPAEADDSGAGGGDLPGATLPDLPELPPLPVPLPTDPAPGGPAPTLPILGVPLPTLPTPPTTNEESSGILP